MKKSFIEKWFPVEELSRDAAIEMSFKPTPAYIARCKELGVPCRVKSFYDPKIRNLHPWLARRPRSMARALNLAALLPYDVEDDFLRYLGFSKKNFLEKTSKDYPPLISYLSPNLFSIPIPKKAIIMDPMAGGGSIPLESAILGINTIACDYNPISYLLLRGTVEFPAKYGLELWKRLVEEVRILIGYTSEQLSPYYEAGIEGYIILRQVELNDKVIPLQTAIPLSRNMSVKIEEDGSLSLTKHKESSITRRKILEIWMKQHIDAMKGDSRLYELTHRCVAVQTQKGFRLANNNDKEPLMKAYSDYLSELGSISLSHVNVPEDNEVFSDISQLKQYTMLFNPRQALALDLLISYIKNRILFRIFYMRKVTCEKYPFGTVSVPYFIFR